MLNAKRKMQNARLLQPVAILAFIILIIGCSDDRTAPTEPGIPSYSATITLLNFVPANGQILNPTFSLRDTIVDAQLIITGQLRPDDGLILFNTLDEEADSIANIILSLSARIVDLELNPARTPEENRELDSLRLVRAAEEGNKLLRELRRDSLDTRLDDRYKVAFKLDNDVALFYPRAVYLDSSTVPTHLNSDEIAIWGQGFYNAPPDTAGWIGKTMRLRLNRFWVADETYRPLEKPDRPANPDALPELYPITNWLERLTPNVQHSLHIQFATPSTVSRLTVSLFVVYKTAG